MSGDSQDALGERTEFVTVGDQNITKLQIPKIDPPVEKKQPSRFQKIDKDKPNASSDSKGETKT